MCQDIETMLPAGWLIASYSSAGDCGEQHITNHCTTNWLVLPSMCSRVRVVEVFVVWGGLDESVTVSVTLHLRVPAGGAMRASGEPRQVVVGTKH
jgi:hypothetical protein